MAKLIGARIERAGVTLASVIGVVAGIQATLAQGADSVTVDVGECVDLRSPEERFACYERQVGAVRTAPTAPAPDARAALAEPPAAPELDSVTGARPEAVGDTPPSTAPLGEPAEPPEFVASVAALRQIVPNSYVITLDNGQIWRQTYAEWYPLLPGQRVTIRPSRWGGTFWLTADDANGFIQVKRVR